MMMPKSEVWKAHSHSREVPSSKAPCSTILLASLLLFLLLGFVLCVLWFLPSCTPVAIFSTPSSTPSQGLKQGPNHPLKSGHRDSSSLASLLSGVKFKNYGIVRSSDRFTWFSEPCMYLEAQNVTGPYIGWADEDYCNYLYQDVDGDLLHPAAGMRSSVPLGGISTGSFELRADGTFHEWTIFNQYPAGAAKIQVIDDVFLGVRMATTGSSTAVVLQTHPNDTRLPAAESLQYQGSHPISRLDVMDSRIPIDVSVYAYPRYKFNDMNTSATPAVAFTTVIQNPLSESVDASILFNLPLGMEPHTIRFQRQMSPTGNPNSSEEQLPTPNALECFELCNEFATCLSWTYDINNQRCFIYDDVRMNGHNDGFISGVKGEWSVVDNCITLSRVALGSSANGDISLCVFSDQEIVPSFGTADDTFTLWKQFASDGKLSGASSGSYVTGAASASVKVGPKQTAEITIVLGWSFPDRDFLGLPVGNFYSHLVRDSVDAAKLLGGNLTSTVMDIQALHRPFFSSSMPIFLQDMLINSLSHIRSAFWLKDGRWRQWEAYDCTNLDSVHNDGERHIPYITIFPNSTINKLYAWAKFQLPNGMIQEQLRCGCQDLPVLPQEVEFGCGRIMSDVSSMFIVYLLELQTWYQDNSITEAVLKDLWQHARLAAEWHMSVSTLDGIPRNLITTYDVLGLRAYPYSSYSSAFHLLAMKAAEKLAYQMGDVKFAKKCHKAFLRGQEALDRLLWNETAQYYNAYSPMDFDYDMFFEASGLEVCDYTLNETGTLSSGHAQEMRRNLTDQTCVEGSPVTPGAIMTDTFYSQVLAYSLGLGTLVQNETRLRLHMKAELVHNDSPYGLLVLTGRFPYPGPNSDNAVWMMGNPNWASISLRLGEDTNKALEVIRKPFEQWRSILHDQWNVPGIVGGLAYGADGLPLGTSHYGYYMSSWHIVMALSGQIANVTEKSLAFSPRLDPPFSLPVLLPTVWGHLWAAGVGNTLDGSVQYTISLEFGSLEFEQLSVHNCKFPHSPFILSITTPATWLCS